MTTTTRKMRVTSVSHHDPSMHMWPPPFMPERIFLSLLGEDSMESIPVGAISFSRVKIKIEGESEKEADVTPISMPVPSHLRNPTVLALSPKEFEELGRPTVGDTLEITISKIA